MLGMIRLESLALLAIRVVLVLFFGSVAIGMIQDAIKKLLEKSKLDPVMHRFVLNATKLLLWGTVILSALKMAGVDITSFLAIFAAAGAAVALALQGSLSNFAGGILVAVTKPFKSGDYISCAGNEGTVQSIDLLYTTINTVDNKRVTIPNGTLVGNAITNFSATGSRMVQIDIGISYDSDIETARKALLELADSVPEVFKDPAPMCVVTDYADSAIKLMLRVWCSGADYWGTRFALLNNVKGCLNNAGVSIPYPQVDVHVKER